MSAHFADEETEAYTQGHTAIRAELGFRLMPSEPALPPRTFLKPFPLAHPHGLRALGVTSLKVMYLLQFAFISQAT